jgi:hypothetical protein
MTARIGRSIATLRRNSAGVAWESNLSFVLLRTKFCPSECTWSSERGGRVYAEAAGRARLG